MKFHIGSQAPNVQQKIAISYVFMISGGNNLKDEPQEIYVTVLLLKKYLSIEKNIPYGFF